MGSTQNVKLDLFCVITLTSARSNIRLLTFMCRQNMTMLREIMTNTKAPTVAILRRRVKRLIETDTSKKNQQVLYTA